jgi:hypothetical protein
LLIYIPFLATIRAFFPTLAGTGYNRAASPKKNSLKSCSFPQKLNLNQVFPSPFANIPCNFSPKLRAGLLPQLVKKSPDNIRNWSDL